MIKYSDDPYPLTIIADRYSGAYSGGKFIAFPIDYWNIPDGPDSGDVECEEFWQNYHEPVGKGKTVQEAYEDLLSKI